MLNTNAAASELSFLVDRALAARRAGSTAVADGLARAAEAILKAAYPTIAADIAQAASRKGQGAEIGARLIEHLDAPSAACVGTVLVLRSARRPVVDALSAAFRHDPAFGATVALLCKRAIAPVVRATVVIGGATIEVAAPHRR